MLVCVYARAMADGHPLQTLIFVLQSPHLGAEESLEMLKYCRAHGARVSARLFEAAAVLCTPIGFMTMEWLLELVGSRERLLQPRLVHECRRHLLAHLAERARALAPRRGDRLELLE